MLKISLLKDCHWNICLKNSSSQVCLSLKNLRCQDFCSSKRIIQVLRYLDHWKIGIKVSWFSTRSVGLRKTFKFIGLFKKYVTFRIFDYKYNSHKYNSHFYKTSLSIIAIFCQSDSNSNLNDRPCRLKKPLYLSTILKCEIKPTVNSWIFQEIIPIFILSNFPSK